MASKTESAVVYAAGAVQGVVLVTFPAASTIFTDPDEYDLSATQYGTMFLPQVVTAIAASLLGTRLAHRYGTKRVYMAGLGFGFASMVVLVVSQFFVDEETLAYGLLLVATASLGVGFGLTVPALNTLIAAFHPDAVGRSVLNLNALLGLGTALAPVFVAVFLGLDFWQGLPLMSASALVVIVLVSARLPLHSGARQEATKTHGAGYPPRFWIYAAFAVLYGICETMNGNWGQLDMTSELGATATQASFALTAFWASVTLGRVLFAAIQQQFPARRAYHALPFVLAVAFGLIAMLPADEPVLAVAAFALAGLGCSALLPLTIGFGQEELVTMSAGVAGGVIAFYQLGYGIAAFGVGPLRSSGVELSTIFGWTAVIAAVMGALSFVVARVSVSSTSSAA